ncbi:MAG TPA: uL15 family ribosomal protein [Candidatus Borkfalkia stercoripullorum]|nr:uL15 family ribosomal protein [Candidatus Borkfalkia stercoripullorum]
MNAFYNSALLSSFWEDLRSGTGGPTMIVLMIVAAAAVVLLVACLILLARRSKIVLDEGNGKKTVIKTGRHKAVRLPAPERDGYTFEGWYTDAACTKRADGTVQASAKSMTLYAKWEKIAEEKLPQDDSEVPANASAESSAVTSLDEQAVREEPAAEEQACEPEASVAEEENVSEPAPQEEPAFEPAPQEESAEEPPLQDVSASEEEKTAETSVSEEDEEETEDEDEASEGDEIDNALVTLVSGTKVFVQYRRSFRARLIQADDEMKDYYNGLRSELLSYVGVKERVSWNYDSYNVGRRQFAKINANRKSIILYLALAPASVDEKYTFRDVSEKKRYAAVPVRYKITGSRSFKYAIELIAQAAAEFGLDYKRFEEKLDIPYEERDELIKKRLIKVYAKRETGETVTEEELEQYIEEGATVESLSAYTVTDRVSVNEAEILISDATAKQLVALAEEAEEQPRAARAKRSYVNLDTVSANFREGEKVDLAALQAKGLVDKKATAYKVLARGSLDKSLTIEANDFSLPAVKMIALTGGRVVKIRKA